MRHEAIVVEEAGVTTRWVVRCPCGLFEAYGDQADAQSVADAHNAGVVP
ncbi:hypothetical protein EV383_4490 [Pseudonocardia sediminis]|uniref:Uncharacterized protein n=1 Tax=Pseudonocardia sediminis TaxID=1397368 RepID=A0A4Q7V0G0_PSEST|nr:hypothetical protein EV383_4490 [Pseudonocardia sediminis]